MKIVVGLAAIVLIAAIMVGCAKRSTVKAGKQDVIDPDFVATIRETKQPHVFEISIRKVNKNTDKSIGSFPVIADLTLKNSSGRVFSGDSQEKRETQVYAREVSEVFDMLRQPGSESLTGRVRLLTGGLPAGKYVVEPRVRIQEIGKGALGGPYAGGTVAVPAGNAVETTIE